MTQKNYFNKLETDVVEAYTTRQTTDPKDPLLELAIIQQKALLSVSADFGQKYHGLSIHQKLEAYLIDLLE